MTPQTYARKFSVGGLCASLTVYPSGNTACNWNRRPSKQQLDAILPEYLDFKRDAMQGFADASGLTIMEIVEIAPGVWMPRSYYPQKEART